MNFFQNKQNVTDDGFKKDIELFKEYQAQASKPPSNNFVFSLLLFWMPCILWVFKMYIFPESQQMSGIYSFYLFIYTLGLAFLIVALIFNSHEKVVEIFIKTATERFEKNLKVSATPKFNLMLLVKYFFTPSMLPFLFMFYVYFNEDNPILFIFCALFLTIITYYMNSTMNNVISHIANLWEKKKMELDKEVQN